MAGRGRGTEEGGETTAGVSERLMFAHAEPQEAPPIQLPQPRAPAEHLPDGHGAVLPVSPTAGGGRIRKQLGSVSLPALRRSVAVAASTEIDRGVGFLLVPVFLAAGVIYYFSLSTEPDLYRPLAAVALMAVFA
ncbi:competence protein, partial [Mesorhizobium sp. M2A.F.Ca.ET.040.01.1.1]